MTSQPLRDGSLTINSGDAVVRPVDEGTPLADVLQALAVELDQDRVERLEVTLGDVGEDAPLLTAKLFSVPRPHLRQLTIRQQDFTPDASIPDAPALTPAEVKRWAASLVALQELHLQLHGLASGLNLASLQRLTLEGMPLAAGLSKLVTPKLQHLKWYWEQMLMALCQRRPSLRLYGRKLRSPNYIRSIS